MQKNIKKLFFSDLVLGFSTTKKIAYIGVLTAFSVVANMFLEFRMYDVQFSFTIAISCLLGIVLGSVFGFTACFVGDFIGYLFNSFGQLYMPWVGLSTGLIAFISGIVFNGFGKTAKSKIYLKLVVVCFLTFLICTIGVNSTGFYFYNLKMGFSSAVINYVAERFNGEVGYLGYVAYRMIFKGQIYNNIFNYALLFFIVPFIFKSKLLNK